MATGISEWQAFHLPCFVYATCRAALVAWPSISGHPGVEMRQELAQLDLRGADTWVDVLSMALGSLAWTSLHDAACEHLKQILQEHLETVCHEPSLSSRIIHGAPSRQQRIQSLAPEAAEWLQEARRCLKQTIVATTQERAQCIFRAAASEGDAAGLVWALPRPRVPKLIRARTHDKRRSTNHAPPWSICSWVNVDHPIDEATIHVSRVMGGTKYACVEGVSLNDLQWREARECLGKRFFYKRCEIAGFASHLTAMVISLSAEFDHLWHSHHSAFLPWLEEGKVVDGWRLLGTHLFGHRLEGNCRLAPVAASVAEAVGAGFCGYSVLSPGTHVPPHAEDGDSSALRVHVALRIPRTGGCGLRVAGQIKVWIQGTVLAFDSTQEHEAWNLSNEDRAVLLLDIGAAQLPLGSWPLWLRSALANAGAAVGEPSGEDVFRDETFSDLAASL
eukprot:CAMPEP_0117512640 /NCGR_PEP_ID=MMETSP0784-20121206/29136_1 /TAXON_ID=39447 /ORGANISM="" /LENGTH=446 /DNA_ID=CAMNT_0005308367 /DNA_START=239 /DNA_END=1579 /DNA_ORIENTATION=+